MEIEEDTVGDEARALFVKLTRTVVKYFYEPKELLVVDFIIKEKCVSERRLEDQLKFDVKLLRITLATLKNDRILTVKSERDVGSDGKRYKVNYYFIKFEQLVNVVKYKLENVRTRLETLERDLSSKDSLHCIPCDKKWTDMESGELFNPTTLKFHCPLCRRPVKEDTSAIPTDTRQLVAKFNEQIGPVYDIVRELEKHFNLQ